MDEMTKQINNLLRICELLGLDTSTNGKEKCELANLYLSRIITFLGG